MRSVCDHNPVIRISTLKAEVPAAPPPAPVGFTTLVRQNALAICLLIAALIVGLPLFRLMLLFGNVARKSESLPTPGMNIRPGLTVRPNELAYADAKFGAVLANLMTTQVARMFSVSSSESVQKVTVLNLADLINEIGTEQEEQIFSALAKRDNKGLLNDLVRHACPTAVILRAGPAMHRSCLNQMPLDACADLIFSLSDKVRETLLAAVKGDEANFAPLFEEFSRIESDSTRQLHIGTEAPRLWQKYIESFRKMLHSDETKFTELSLSLDEWMSAHLDQNRGQHVA